jgi:DNA-binding winged helix-turn-helix (wHTH) protein
MGKAGARPYLLAGEIVALTALLTAILGGLHLYRYLENAKVEFAKRAALSAQVFAESVSATAVMADGPSEVLQRLTRAFVRGDVLYAQVVRGGQVIAEDRVEAAQGLDLAVDKGFPGHLVYRERRLPDGIPYLDVLRPFTGEPPERAREAMSYVRVGISLREVGFGFQREALLTIGVGAGILLLVGLLALGSAALFTRLARLSLPTREALGPEANGQRRWLRVGTLQIDPIGKEVYLDDRKVELSPKEYELIRLLASEPGRVFSNHEILQNVWPKGHTATAKDVKQYIYLLRRKLEPDPKNPQWIVTVKGFGYKLIPPKPLPKLQQSQEQEGEELR